MTQRFTADHLLRDSLYAAACRDVVEPDLQDLIRATIASGFSAEEVLIAISELVAEDFAAVVKVPSVH